MDARLLTRCTNVAMVAVVGMAAGHLLMPGRPTASARTAFVLSVTLAGALAGWRERAATARYRGAIPSLRDVLVWSAAGVATALMLAWAAWQVVHG